MPDQMGEGLARLFFKPRAGRERQVRTAKPIVLRPSDYHQCLSEDECTQCGEVKDKLCRTRAGVCNLGASTR